MRLRFDKFTWIVVAVVLLLVAAAVVTVNLTSTQPDTPTAYRTDDNPTTPVFNALIAVQQGDVVRARAQFTQKALAQNKDTNYDPIANAVTNYANDTSSRRTRIIEVNYGSGATTGDEAFVTIAEDNYGGGGLFGRSTYTNQRIIRVVREEGVWKIAENNLFY